MAEPPTPGSSPSLPQRRLILVAPVLIFASVAAMFGVALQKGDPSRLPSALVGRSAPPLDLAPLAELVDSAGSAVPGINTARLKGNGVSVVNFWASWCGPCVEEHPLLVELAKRLPATVYGVNYKDQAANARRFLGRYGNPFKAVGVDASGRTAVDWGVTGMPETFVVDGKGVIVFKHVGQITPSALEQGIIPAILAAARAD